MKKQISKLGKTLKKSEQKEINGGFNHPNTHAKCFLCRGRWVVWNNTGHCLLTHRSPCYRG